MHRLRLGPLIAAVLLLAGCHLRATAGSPAASTSDGAGSSQSAPPEEMSAGASPSAPDGSGIPLGEVVAIDWEQLHDALLGEEPYPSGWEDEVDALIAELRRQTQEIRIPDVTGMDPVAASCALWSPLVGNTGWASGAVLERQVFIAHVAGLAEVAPNEIRAAAEGALETAFAAAAEQMTPDGDPAIIGRHPSDAIETIGRWAVEHCALPVQAAEPPETEGWTDAEIAQSCDWDRTWLEDAQEAYRAGPGDGRYAEHPHLLEVTNRAYAYTQWHRAVVDNAVDPPTMRVEPIPGSFCDR